MEARIWDVRIIKPYSHLYEFFSIEKMIRIKKLRDIKIFKGSQNVFGEDFQQTIEGKYQSQIPIIVFGRLHKHFR